MLGEAKEAFELFVARRIRGQKSLRQSDGAQRQAKETVIVGRIGHSHLQTAATDVQKEAQRKMKAKTAHDAEADQASLLFLGKDVQGHANFLAVPEEGACILCLSESSRRDRMHR